MEDLIVDDHLDESIFYDVVELNVSVASNVLVEDSSMDVSGFTDFEENSPPEQSTPRKTPKRPKAPARDKAAAPPEPRIQCSKCPKTYKNKRTLKVHSKMHNMKNISTRMPKKLEMDKLTRESILNSCNEIQEEKCQFGAAVDLIKLCAFIAECVTAGEGVALITFLSECTHNIIKDQNALLPSDLRNVVNRKTNKLLSAQDFRQKMKDILDSIQVASPEVVNLFIGCVCSNVFHWQLVFVFRILRGQSTDGSAVSLQKYSSDDSHPRQFKQLIYYIGGAVLKGILKKAKLYSSNPDWARLGDVTERKFISKPYVHASNVCAANVTCFTEEKDRGGLTLCNQEAFDFFMHLFNLIMSVEGSDGSLPPDKVEGVIFDNYVLLFMWDEIVGVDLTEDQSIQLFSDIVRCSVKVVAKGILKRRLNEQLSKSYSSVSLRTRIAR